MTIQEWVLDEIPYEGGKLVIKPPIHYLIERESEYYIIMLPDFFISVVEKSKEDVVKELVKEITLMWEAFAMKPGEHLIPGARRIKEFYQARIRRAESAT